MRGLMVTKSSLGHDRVAWHRVAGNGTVRCSSAWHRVDEDLPTSGRWCDRAHATARVLKSDSALLSAWW